MLFRSTAPTDMKPSSAVDIVRQELARKCRGYMAQDARKWPHATWTTPHADFVRICARKLVDAQLTCAYCACRVHILFRDVRATNQWSLDRIDNSRPHTAENTVIACLQCNLQRRRRREDSFLAYKQTVFTKCLADHSGSGDDRA